MDNLAIKLLEIQVQFKFLHWQTHGDAKHRAYGDTYDGLGGLIDDFIEAHMGKYGRPTFDGDFTLSFKDISTISMQSFIDDIVEFLVGLTDVLDGKYDTDLLNLRDEMLGLINKLKYLLTLKS